MPEGVRGLIVSGPNAGGKSVIAKAIGLAALAKMIIPAEKTRPRLKPMIV